MTAVPHALIGELCSNAINAEVLERSVLETEFSKKLQKWDKQQVGSRSFKSGQTWRQCENLFFNVL